MHVVTCCGSETTSAYQTYAPLLISRAYDIMKDDPKTCKTHILCEHKYIGFNILASDWAVPAELLAVYTRYSPLYRASLPETIVASEHLHE